MTITVDLDGVVVGGIYVSEWDRKPKIYASLPVIDGACNGIWHLAVRHNVYWLTSRSFEQAGLTSIDWLKFNNFPLGSGVITGVPSDCKKFVAKALGAAMHIDDNPAIVSSLIGTGVVGVLFVGRDESGWWAGTREWIDSGRPYFNCWDTMSKWIEKRLSL